MTSAPRSSGIAPLLARRDYGEALCHLGDYGEALCHLGVCCEPLLPSPLRLAGRDLLAETIARHIVPASAAKNRADTLGGHGPAGDGSFDPARPLRGHVGGCKDQAPLRLAPG